MQVKAERRLAKGLTFLTAYTWAKAISGPNDIGGQVGGGEFIGAPQDIWYLEGEHSVSGFDLTQRFVQTVIYDVPFFKSMQGAAKHILDGWQLSTIITEQSGFPAPVTRATLDTTGTGIQFATRSGPGAGRQLAAQRTDLDSLVQHGCLYHSPVWPLRHLFAHGGHPASWTEQCGFFGIEIDSLPRIAISAIPSGNLQPVQPLQSHSSLGGSQPDLSHLRHDRRRCSGFNDPRDSSGSEVLFLREGKSPLGRGKGRQALGWV